MGRRVLLRLCRCCGNAGRGLNVTVVNGFGIIGRRQEETQSYNAEGGSREIITC
jgi:hypothetical protein